MKAVSQSSLVVPTNPAMALRTSHRVTAICWFGLFAEGYDIGVFGAVLPSMMADPAWGLQPAAAGMIASAVLVGMFFGGFLFGGIADRWGRKPTFMLCLTLFSIASGCAALAPTAMQFALFRFIAGVGVGGIIPVCAALTSEYAPPGRANRAFGLMYTGYSLGIFISALVSAVLVSAWGWRVMVGIGIVPAAVTPLLLWLLPESLSFLRAKGRYAEAETLAKQLGIELADATDAPREDAGWWNAISALFGDANRSATFGFILANFAGMVLVYGLNTWLPQIMRGAGYELGPSIMFLGAFALASAFGGVLLGTVADRVGPARTIMGAFAMGACAILTLSLPWPLPVTYLIVALAGIGSVSTAVMVSSYAANYYPARLRGTAVGCFLSISRFGAVCGPILGGAILQYGLDFFWNFVLFAIAAFGGALAILLVSGEKA